MFALIAAQPNLRWMNVETTAPGITFGQYAMTTKDVPHVVQLIAVDPQRADAALRHRALARSRHLDRRAHVGSRRCARNAVAGANGDYFDIGRTYEPQGLLIKSGVLLHGPTDHEAVVFDRDEQADVRALSSSRGSVVDGARRYPITLVQFVADARCRDHHARLRQACCRPRPA